MIVLAEAGALFLVLGLAQQGGVDVGLGPQAGALLLVVGLAQQGGDDVGLGTQRPSL